MESEFDILAAKVLAQEASPEEQSRLDVLLSQNPERRQQFEELTATWRLLQKNAPLIEAMDAAPAPVPEEHLQRLLAEVRDTGRRNPRQWGGNNLWLLAASFALLGCLAGALLFSNRPTPHQAKVGIDAYLLPVLGQADVRRAGEPVQLPGFAPLHLSDEIFLASNSLAGLMTSNGLVVLHGPLNAPIGTVLKNQSGPKPNSWSTEWRTALFSPRSELLAASLLVTMRSSEAIPVYSPVGATANLTPLVHWKSAPGKRYDLVITDELKPATPPWRVSGVSSPVDFSSVDAWKGRPLVGDGLYRLRLSETGQPLTSSEYTFRTLSGATALTFSSPRERFLGAAQRLNSDPACIGDALAALLTLPPDLANSDLALRLKLLLFGQLGYQADYERTTMDLQASMTPK